MGPVTSGAVGMLCMSVESFVKSFDKGLKKLVVRMNISCEYESIETSQ
jgi:hypothetical protein